MTGPPDERLVPQTVDEHDDRPLGRREPQGRHRRIPTRPEAARHGRQDRDQRARDVVRSRR